MGSFDASDYFFFTLLRIRECSQRRLQPLFSENGENSPQKTLPGPASGSSLINRPFLLPHARRAQRRNSLSVELVASSAF